MRVLCLLSVVAVATEAGMKAKKTMQMGNMMGSMSMSGGAPPMKPAPNGGAAPPQPPSMGGGGPQRPQAMQMAGRPGAKRPMIAPAGGAPNIPMGLGSLTGKSIQERLGGAEAMIQNIKKGKAAKPSGPLNLGGAPETGGAAPPKPGGGAFDGSKGRVGGMSLDGPLPGGPTGPKGPTIIEGDPA